MDPELTEQKLAKLSHAQVAEELRALTDDDLLTLMEAKLNRVGDTAADLLDARGKHDALIDAILNSQIQTSLGKIRATSVFHRWGKRLPRAEKVYLALLSDTSARVVENALFGLVFLQNKKNIAKIEEARAQTRSANSTIKEFDQAIEALVKGDPYIFSPYFHDADNVWQLGQ